MYQFRIIRCCTFAQLPLRSKRLKPQSNGPLYSNTAIGTQQGGAGPAMALPSPLLAVPDITAQLSTASVPASYRLMGHYNRCRFGLVVTRWPRST